MTFQISDFTVMVDTTGNIQSIQGPNGMSIPADPGNSRYQDFMAVDTDSHLCTRGKHNANAGRTNRSNGRCPPCIAGGISDDQRNVSLFREHEKTGKTHGPSDRQCRGKRIYRGRRSGDAEGDVNYPALKDGACNYVTDTLQLAG